MHGGDASGSTAPVHSDVGHTHYQGHEYPVHHSIYQDESHGHRGSNHDDHGHHHDHDHKHHHHHHEDEAYPPPSYMGPYPGTFNGLYGTMNTETHHGNVRRRLGSGGLDPAISVVLVIALVIGLVGSGYMINDLLKCRGNLGIWEKVQRGCCRRDGDEFYCP